MLKQILNLEGARELSRKEQQKIKGGRRWCADNSWCAPGVPCCLDNFCKDRLTEPVLGGPCAPDIDPV